MWLLLGSLANLQFLYVFLDCIIFWLNKNELNWTELNWSKLNALLKFEISATWNCKRVTANCSWRFAAVPMKNLMLKASIICLYYYPQKVCNFSHVGIVKLNWNTTALSQSNCRNFSCSIIKKSILGCCSWSFFFFNTKIRLLFVFAADYPSCPSNDCFHIFLTNSVEKLSLINKLNTNSIGIEWYEERLFWKNQNLRLILHRMYN